MTGPVTLKFHIGKEIRKGYLASVYNYRPRNEEILARKGEVFAVLRLKTHPDFDLMTAGGILLDFFHETYFEMRESSTLMALEKTVISSGKHLAKLIEGDKKVGETGIDVDLIAVAIVDDRAYFVNAGESKLFIYREGETVDLTKALKDPTGEGLVEVASMVLNENDRLLMMTEVAGSLISNSQTEKILKSFDLDEFPEETGSDHEHALMLIGYSVDEKHKKEDESIAITEDLEAERMESAVETDEDGELETKKEEVQESDEVETENEFEEKTDEDEVSEERLDEPFEEEQNNTFDEEHPKTQKTYQVLLSNAKNYLKSLPAKVSDKIADKRSGRETLGDSARTPEQETKKKYLIIGIAVVLCAGTLYLGVRQAIKSNEQKIQTEEVQVSLDTLEEKVELIEELVADIKLADSTEKRQQGLEEVGLAKEEIKKVEDFDSVKDKVEDYRKRIETAENYFNRIISVSKDDVFVDVASFFPDSKVSDIAFSTDKLYLVDEGLGKLYSVGYDGSNIEEVVSDLTSPTSVTVDNNGKVIFLDSSEENRIGIYDPVAKTTRRIVGTSESRIGDVADIEYAQIGGGRIYLIDRTNTRVMYLEKSGENYGLPASRFTLSELSTGKDIFIIDNKIYTLAGIKQGLYRTFNNQDDTPELIGLPEGQDMLSATGLFIDGTNIYFSDPVEGRIAVFDKGIQTAKFKGQYKSKDNSIFSGVKDLVVVASQGKIYTVDQSKVYSLDLSKLNEL